MKKIILASIVLASFISVTTSCRKEEKRMPADPITEINVNLEINQVYQTTIANVVKAEGFKISEQPNHFTSSEAVFNSDLKNIVYKYTPALDYVGTDRVVIVTGKCEHHNCGEHHDGEHHDGEHHDGCEHHKGHKKHHHDSDDRDEHRGNTYVINFNIISSKPAHKDVTTVK